jgi:hypothetical protein
LFKANDLGSAELNRWREDFPSHYRDGSPIAAVNRRQALCLRHGWTLSRGAFNLDAALAPSDRRVSLPVTDAPGLFD